MSRGRARRRPRAQTREDLLDAAARVFAERGFHGASVEAVSEAAGFSTGAVYSNLANKEELFLSLYEERIERRRRELRHAVANADEPAAGLASAARSVETSLRKDRDFFLLYFEFALHAARNPAFARRFAAVREDGLSELANRLSEGFQRAGVRSRLPAEDLARAVRALSYGLALDGLLDEGAGPDDLVARILTLVISDAGDREES